MSRVLRLLGGILLALHLPFGVQAAPPKLVVYTYDSFTSDWGPGPQVKTAFEAKCACSLELVGLEDGVSMLNRLKLEGSNTSADLLLGIDTNLTAEARATGVVEQHADRQVAAHHRRRRDRRILRVDRRASRRRRRRRRTDPDLGHAVYRGREEDRDEE